MTEIARSASGTKITRVPCRRRNGEAVPRAVNFGDLITADHKVLSDNCESRKQSSIRSRGTGFSYSMDPGVSVQKQKLHKKPQRSSQKVPGTQGGNWKSFTLRIPWNSAKACEDLSWNHCTSTPHRSETNGIAERAVRRVNQGTSAVLLQSGLNESWWADSMECYTYLRNVTDLQSDRKTPYERRFGQPFNVNTMPPNTAIHEQNGYGNGYVKVCTTTSTPSTTVRPWWTTTWMTRTHVDMRKMKTWAHLHAVCSCIAWFIHHTHMAQAARTCLS